MTPIRASSIHSLSNNITCQTKDKNYIHAAYLSYWMDILVMLTPRSGHTDPPKDFGQKDKLMTILQFFS